MRCLIPGHAALKGRAHPHAVGWGALTPIEDPHSSPHILFRKCVFFSGDTSPLGTGVGYHLRHQGGNKSRARLSSTGVVPKVRGSAPSCTWL